MANPSPLDPGTGPPSAKERRQPQQVDIEQTMRRLALEATGKGPISIPDDPDFAMRFSALWAWMTATQIAEEYRKDAPRLMISIEGSAWRVTLSDSALKCSLTASGNTFQEALGRLNSSLIDPDAPWNRWKRKGAKLEVLKPEEKKTGHGKRKA